MALLLLGFVDKLNVLVAVVAGIVDIGGDDDDENVDDENEDEDDDSKFDVDDLPRCRLVIFSKNHLLPVSYTAYLMSRIYRY